MEVHYNYVNNHCHHVLQMDSNVSIKICVHHILPKLLVVLVELMVYVYGMDNLVPLCNHVLKLIKIRKLVCQLRIVVLLNMLLVYLLVPVMLILVNLIKRQMVNVILFMIGINLLKGVVNY